MCPFIEGTSVTRLGNFLDFGLAAINLPKSPIFLGNFSKGVKIYHFSCEIIFGKLLKTFGDFFLVTLETTQAKGVRKKVKYKEQINNSLNVHFHAVHYFLLF